MLAAGTTPSPMTDQGGVVFPAEEIGTYFNRCLAAGGVKLAAGEETGHEPQEGELGDRELGKPSFLTLGLRQRVLGRCALAKLKGLSIVITIKLIIFFFDLF